jgi:hypothetical protein
MRNGVLCHVACALGQSIVIVTRLHLVVIDIGSDVASDPDDDEQCSALARVV